MSDIKLKDVLKFGNNFCILPFMHEFLDINFTKKVCCNSDDKITDIRLDQIRSEMLENKPIPECADCVSCEKQKVFSERQLTTRLWVRRFPDLMNDCISKPHIYSYDLRYSNLCNLRCQTCGPGSSSEWAKFLNKENVYNSWNPSAIEINNDAKRVYLAGGEPFMIKSFSSALNNLENKDCEIVINTNATVLTEHMLSALEPFSNVCLTLSIDGTGETIERIRTLCSWDMINRNIEILRKRLNPIFMVNTVVQKDNIDNIPELTKWIDDQDIEMWHTTICTDPDEFHYRHYTGMINWSDDFWNSSCFKKSIQAKNTLKKVYNDLIQDLG